MPATSVKAYVIAALIFAAMLTGAMTLIGNSIPNEQTRADFGRYNRTYDRFDDLKVTTDKITGDMETTKPTEGPEGLVSGMWDKTFGVVQTVWASVTITGEVIGDLSDGSALSMPVWFTALIIAIIGITIAFAIIASIRKWYI